MTNIVAISLVKNEASIIGRSLEHLHRLGVRRFVVADNGSVDGTVAILDQFESTHEGTTLVVLHDPLKGYHQSRKMTALAKFASHYFESGFIYPFDADEFLFPPAAENASLAELIAGDGWDYLQLAWISCVEQKDGSILGCVEPAHVGKLVARWNDTFVIAQGNHCLESTKTRLFSSRQKRLRPRASRWRVLHFPVRTRQQLKAKILGSHEANQVNPRQIGHHWHALYEAYERGGDRVFEDLFDIIMGQAAGDQPLERFCAVHQVKRPELSYFEDYAQARTRLRVRLPE